MKREIILASICVLGCNSNTHNGNTGDDDDTHVDAPKAIDAPADSGSISNEVAEFPLKSVQGGIAYTVSVKIGTQMFDLDTDTGSTTLGVAATACTTCNVTPEYTPGATAKDQGSKCSSMYADGSGWMAENFSDNVSFAGESSNVNMRFGSIQSQTNFFQGFDQGIIGFASSTIALSGTDSVIAKRMAAGANGQFAFQFCTNDGKLWMGGYDAAATQSAPQLSPMVPLSAIQPFYEVSVQGAKIGGTSVTLSGSAVADTGTSILVVSSAQAKSITSAISNSAGFKATFPGVTLTGGACFDPGALTHAQIDAALPAMAITLPLAGGGTFDLTLPATQSYLLDQQAEGMGMCYAVESINQPGIPIIMGDTILRGFVTVFDVTGKTIGFAPQKGCVLPPEPATRVPFDASLRPHWYIRGHRI
jgi:hypothetical protein